MPTFLKLYEIVKIENYINQDYCKRVQVVEVICMALHYVSYDKCHRNFVERFQHLTKIIHKNIIEALQAILRLAPVLHKSRN